MKRVALIGHRGVGKTSLVRRIRSYYGSERVHCLDLDEKIVEREGRSIFDIFESDGEDEFRELERNAFVAIDREVEAVINDCYLAVGAGFDPNLIPETWHVVWVRRESDALGRVFHDRPRLNASVSALEEFQERFEKRQSAYSKRANSIYVLPEGQTRPSATEQELLIGKYEFSK